MDAWRCCAICEVLSACRFRFNDSERLGASQPFNRAKSIIAPRATFRESGLLEDAAVAAILTNSASAHCFETETVGAVCLDIKLLGLSAFSRKRCNAVWLSFGTVQDAMERIDSPFTIESMICSRCGCFSTVDAIPGMIRLLNRILS